MLPPAVRRGPAAKVPGQPSRVQSDKVRAAGSQMGDVRRKRRTDRDFLDGNNVADSRSQQNGYLQPLLVEFGAQDTPACPEQLQELRFIIKVGRKTADPGIQRAGPGEIT